MERDTNKASQVPLLEALRYAGLGWAVLPLHAATTAGGCSCGRNQCRSPGKHPALRRGVSEASRDPHIIKQWFGGPETRNVGIATGEKSGLIVLDVDPKNGGDETLEEFRTDGLPLLSDVVVNTGGDGTHYYYACPDTPVPCSAGSVGRGLDVRGNGGYVVAPPSIHASGKHYTWADFSRIALSDLRPPPAWLTHSILSTKGHKLSGAGSVFRKGERNTGLMAVAGRCRYDGKEKTDILNVLLAANNDQCVPPLDQEEISAIAESVMRYPPGRGRRHGAPIATRTEAAKKVGAVPHLPSKKQRMGASQLFTAVDPWPTSPDGPTLMDTIHTLLSTHLCVAPAYLDALVLWIAFTHAHDCFHVSPLLAVVSPEKRCGKTTLLSCLRRLVYRPLAASNVTPAALFRAVDRWKPTLLIDEADTFLQASEELRGILNSGHQKDLAAVIRSVGDNHEPHVFSTWSPKALAKIGSLPSTITDRAIVLSLRRKKVSELRRSLAHSDSQPFDDAARMLVRWAQDNAGALSSICPARIAHLHDRAQDNWAPLLAIAHVVGARWPISSVKAARYVSQQQDTEDSETPATLLLQDIYAAFSTLQCNRLPSQDLTSFLAKMEHRPWPEWRSYRPITPRQLAQLLRPFQISPKTIRLDEHTTVKGYERHQFDDAFSRYIRMPSVTP